MAKAAEKTGDRRQAIDHLRQALAVSERLDWPQLRDDKVLSFRLSGRLWSLGLQFETLASDASLPAPVRRGQWQQAVTSFERSLKVFSSIARPLPPMVEIEDLREDFYRHLPAKIQSSKDQLQRLAPQF
jgi:hypothetical protein